MSALVAVRVARIAISSCGLRSIMGFVRGPTSTGDGERERGRIDPHRKVPHCRVFFHL